MKNPTIDKVIFRVSRNDATDVFALFPLVPYDVNGCYCQCYQYVGGHSGADYTGCIASSRPARLSEYRRLARELRRIGYRLKIISRAPSNAYQQRKIAAT